LLRVLKRCEQAVQNVFLWGSGFEVGVLVEMEMVEVGVVFGGDLLDGEIGVGDSGLCIAELAL
jgi:hypothetical protein